jgi:hypothetical protein
MSALTRRAWAAARRPRVAVNSRAHPAWSGKGDVVTAARDGRFARSRGKGLAQ